MRTPEGSLSFSTNSSVKQVFLDNTLLRSIAYQRVFSKRFEVARLHGEITPSLDNQLIFDELHEGKETVKGGQQFDRKSLFLVSKEYKLIEL